MRSAAIDWHTSLKVRSADTLVTEQGPTSCVYPVGLAPVKGPAAGRQWQDLTKGNAKMKFRGKRKPEKNKAYSFGPFNRHGRAL